MREAQRWKPRPARIHYEPTRREMAEFIDMVIKKRPELVDQLVVSAYWVLGNPATENQWVDVA